MQQPNIINWSFLETIIRDIQTGIDTGHYNHYYTQYKCNYTNA